MPWPQDIVLRGSSVDALEGQRLSWAGFNARTDEGNRSAIAQAQAQQNQWLAQVAQQRDAAQRQDFEAQQQASAQAREAAANQQKMAEDTRRFNVSSKQQDAKQAADERAAKMAYDFTQGQKTSQLDAIENTGNAMQPEIDAAGRARDKAAETYAQQDASFTKLRTKIEKDLGLSIKWNDKAKEFVGRADLGTPELNAQAAAAAATANARVAEDKARHDAATLAYQTHMAHFDALSSNVTKDGLLVKKSGDGYVLYSPNHPNGGKTFGKMVKDASAAADPLPPGVPYAGFTGGATATATTPAPAAVPVPPQAAPAPSPGFRGVGAGGSWEAPTPPPPASPLSFNQTWPGFGGAGVQQPQAAPAQPAATPPAAAISPAPNDRHAETLVPGKTYLVFGKPMQWDGENYVGKGFMGTTEKASYSRSGYLKQPEPIPASETSKHWDPKTSGEGFSYVDRLDEAPINPKKRVYGKVYLTPKGPMQWTGGPDGEGWIPAT